MSPSWRERACVFAGDGEVRLQVYGAGLKPAPRQQARGATLREALQGVRLQRAHADVTLSNQLVRYALVPDADVLRNDVERRAAAAHALSHTFGEMAQHWEVAADRAGFFPGLLAAGIDARLRSEIESALREAGATSVSIQPALARALNQAGPPRGSGWLAVLEPQRIVLAAFAAGALVAVRSQRVRSSARQELPVLLEQSRLLDGIPPDADEVVVCAQDAEALQVDGFRCRLAPLDFTAPQRAPRPSDRLALEFGRHSPTVRATDAAWLAVGAAVLGFAGWQYAGLATERADLRAALADADRFTRRQTTRPLEASGAEARLLAADVARANAVAARLQVPWEALFTDLETAAGEGITLLGFEPEGGMRRLRITGEARRFEDLTQYLRRLEATPALHNVFLTGHELRGQGVTFTLNADWIRSDDPARP